MRAGHAPKVSVVLAALVTLGACGGSRAEVRADRVEGPAPASAPSPTSPPERRAGCTLPPPDPAPPSLLVEHALAPTAPPRVGRDRRARRTIVLDCMDCYGPLQVSRVAPDGVATHLGQGSDPRIDGDGGLSYLDLASPRALVHVARDGRITRTTGGAGRLEGVGSPLRAHRAPFTPDGRHQLVTRGRCDDPESRDACVLELHRDDPALGRTPIDTLALDASASDLTALYLSDDASVIAACVRVDEDWHLVRADRRTGARIDRTLPGSCHAFGREAERVLVRGEGGTFVVDVESGATRALVPTVAIESATFDACGERVLVVGPLADDDTVHRVERFDAATGTPITVLELREGPLGWARFDSLRLDRRGWLAVVTDPMLGPVRVWLVPSADGAAREIALEGRVHDVHLGPSAL